MPLPHRKRLKRTEGGFHFLTFSTYHRLPFFSNPRIADLFVSSLATARSKVRFSLVAWVVMPEHVHLILLPAPDLSLPQTLMAIKQPVAQRVIDRWRELHAPILNRIRDKSGSNHFWQPGAGFDRNVRTEDKLTLEIFYIHQNPVKRGLVASPTDWPWSSARWYAGRRENTLAIDLPWGKPLADLLAHEAAVQGDKSLLLRRAKNPPDDPAP